ncbi:MAG: MFS transporter [Chloroflexota bacterium]
MRVTRPVAEAEATTYAQGTPGEVQLSPAAVPTVSGESSTSAVLVAEHTSIRPSLPFFGKEIALPASLRALGHRNFRLYWSGQLVSLVGTWMQTIARGWLVLELTHSAFWLGMVGLANSLPVLILSLWAGTIVDSVSKRALVMWTQAISMVSAFVLAGLTLTQTVQVWHVIAISLLLGTVFAFDAPARQSFTVEMVGKEDLMNAVALNSSIFNGARVAGPAIGAIALAIQGPGLAFLLNGFSYLAVLIGLFMMKLPPHVRKKESSNSMQRMMEGLQFVRKDEAIGTLMLLTVTVSIFAFPYAVLMPIFADDVLKVGNGGYGMLMAFTGIGSLLGALSLTVQSGRSVTNRGRIIMLGALGLPFFLGIFSLSQSYLLSLAMLIGVGWTMISINATINTVVQTGVPDELRGRVNGVFAFLFIGMAPAGNLQAGLLADHFGAPMAVFLGSAVCALVVIYMFIKKRRVFSLQ